MALKAVVFFGYFRSCARANRPGQIDFPRTEFSIEITSRCEASWLCSGSHAPIKGQDNKGREGS